MKAEYINIIIAFALIALSFWAVLVRPAAADTMTVTNNISANADGAAGASVHVETVVNGKTVENINITTSTATSASVRVHVSSTINDATGTISSSTTTASTTATQTTFFHALGAFLKATFGWIFQLRF